ncbi:hypothetical protein Tco_1118795, partial [Tanacetum coccineum]
HGFVRYPFHYRVTLGFGSIAGGLDPVSPVIRLSIKDGINSGTRVGTMAGVDINTLTMEQYLALSRENQASGVVKPEIEGNVNFEIKSQFMSLSNNSNTNGLAAIVSKLDNLGRDMKKLKENVHAIQLGCQIYKGPHLDKECPQGYYTRTDDQTPFEGKRPNVVETINKYMEEAAKRQAEQDEWLKTFYQNTENNRIDHDKIIQKLESQVKTLTTEVETKATILEGCKAIFAKDGTPLYAPFYYSHEEIEYFSSNSDFLDDEKSESTEVKTSKVIPELTSNLPKQAKRFGNEYDDNDEFEDPDRCGECKENEILETIINKLHDEWFKGTDEDDNDLEEIIDYLEPTIYDGFIDSDDEECNERKCTLLGTPYIKPPPIFIEKVNVTRYSIGPREVYRKLKNLEVEELSRTRGNIATIRAKIMNEILKNDDKKESYDET